MFFKFFNNVWRLRYDQTATTNTNLGITFSPDVCVPVCRRITPLIHSVLPLKMERDQFKWARYFGEMRQKVQTDLSNPLQTSYMQSKVFNFCLIPVLCDVQCSFELLMSSRQWVTYSYQTQPKVDLFIRIKEPSSETCVVNMNINCTVCSHYLYIYISLRTFSEHSKLFLNGCHFATYQWKSLLKNKVNAGVFSTLCVFLIFPFIATSHCNCLKSSS